MINWSISLLEKLAIVCLQDPFLVYWIWIKKKIKEQNYINRVKSINFKRREKSKLKYSLIIKIIISKKDLFYKKINYNIWFYQGIF